MSTRAFYAVKMRSGMVMTFEWHPEEIAEAYLNRGVVGVIRSIEAEGSIPAEAEAQRLFAAGQFDSTAMGASIPPMMSPEQIEVAATTLAASPYADGPDSFRRLSSDLRAGSVEPSDVLRVVDRATELADLAPAPANEPTAPLPKPPTLAKRGGRR